MAGPVTLKSQKALLTRYCNNLNNIIDKSKEFTDLDINFYADPKTRVRVQKLIFELTASTKLVDEALANFTVTVDSLGESITTDQEAQAQDYIEKAHQSLGQARVLAIDLEAKVFSAREELDSSNNVASNEWQSATLRPKLPAIPIPIFTGKAWEFENFWTLFEANVNSQPLTKLQKFNYLISALRGEAKETIQRYPISEDNYDNAVDLLKRKYGDKFKLISRLQSRLENAKAEKYTIQAQRKLLEFIIPITIQLQKLGVSLDGSFYSQKILAKFSASIQRKILEHKMENCQNEDDWKIEELLEDLDKQIATEERISDMIVREPINQFKNKTSSSLDTPIISPACIFCGSQQHRALFCSKYATLEQRRKFFEESKRCFNCAKEGHSSKQCTGTSCKLCAGKKHHHTLCPIRARKDTEEIINRGPPSKQKSTKETFSRPHTRTITNRTQRLRPTAAEAHPIQTVDAENDQKENFQAEMALEDNKTVVLHNQNSTSCNDTVLLLTGLARVKDEKRNRWREVEILFDTGADKSFISLELARELELDSSSSQQLMMYTFGSEDPKPTMCKVTMLDLWDQQNKKHRVQLCATPILIGRGKKAHLTEADRNFISRNNLHLSKTSWNEDIRPQILLGCDQLWNFLSVPSPKFRLPSGLQLIPSRLGYLLCGKQHRGSLQGKEIQQPADVVINTLLNFDDELKQWDKYWTLDSSGVCEFTGTRNAEKAAINEKVRSFFDETIQKRSDGYYVRLPFKENHPPLPTNEAIARKRLISVLATLALKPDILQEYQKIFEDQLEKGIIEEIPNHLPPNGLLHYIPHQPVITPNKETTKVRIVFDASSHYKQCPSLNDVLHQGPLILPDLFAILLRFRVPKYAITADVEKAFLQVHLHEQDRDVTRFFWVYDVRRPAEGNNVKTMRFTRVTFGLNVSPFLLGRTIQFHLENSTENAGLSKEIRENLYVDNLVLTANTHEEAKEKAIQAREIFKNMKMNLREFASNDTELRDHLPAEAYSKNSSMKLLGIKWETATDCLSIQCEMPATQVITKRVVARRIASIYDPFGWLTPLLTKPKRFQQQLWKNKLDWDTPLPDNLIKEWNALRLQADGFQKSFQRRVPHNTRLAIFSDASEIAMAACAYLFNNHAATLIAAKCKFPSIQAKTTIPKMEMNALTMAVRLAFSICKGFGNEIYSDSKEIYILSDSKIALHWAFTKQGSSKVGVLVSNRIAEIQKILEKLQEMGHTVHFEHVPTDENPADTATRGLTKEQIQDHIWWMGPQFLIKDHAKWPTLEFTFANQDMKTTAILNPILGQTEKEKPVEILTLQRYSTFTTAKRVMSWILLFVLKSLKGLSQQRRSEIITSHPELQELNIPPPQRRVDAKLMKTAELVLLKNHQTLYLNNQYRKSMENTLRLFQDQEKIWRSRGRLDNSALNPDTKSPIFVAPKTELANLLLQEAHSKYHRGIEHTIAVVREHYWIPKLRQQVRRLIGTCFQCKRFNGLPYRYPDSSSLPGFRTQQSRTFQHIGLDFFNLPDIHENEAPVKAYGCIFTCATTRLIHLEVVKSMSTNDFLNAFRRFIARRGVPDSVTCDNAPTFLLSETILTTEQQPQINTESLRLMANQNIEWRHITPYAPWQGGFYERLIKCIKYSLYKAIRPSAISSFDHLTTVMTEIEACLNSRPLTYQGSDRDSLNIIRPIDFVQRNMILTFPYSREELSDDPTYYPREEMQTIETRLQAEKALQSSCAITEQFWKIWKDQYLVSLREKHKKNIAEKRHCNNTPKIDDVVLINDPVLPRNDWKIARITKLDKFVNGEPREAELMTNKNRKIRRPVNLIIPLEISEDHYQKENEEIVEDPPINQECTTHSYNLRPRKQKNYVDCTITENIQKKPSKINAKWFLFHIMLFHCIVGTWTSKRDDIMLSCTKNGIVIETSKTRATEVCADNQCKLQNLQPGKTLMVFSPSVTLHDHLVTLKWNENGRTRTAEKLCDKLSFCDNIDCWFCATVVLNPECWPIGAIISLALILYGIIAAVYLALYVPVTIGKPIRVLFWLLLLTIKLLLNKGWQCVRAIRRRCQRARHRSRSTRLTEALAIVVSLVSVIGTISACQQIDVLEHHLTICEKANEKESCSIAIKEVLKLSTFKQEACLRLTKNGSHIENIKVRWRGLRLYCDKETLFFTRATNLQVVDSKRCPHMGSCTGQKCAAINANSIIPELQQGNQFPGRTGCLESCGGLGCDCFYPSSGCLFYRIYATPKNSDVYEIFRCERWREDIKLDIYRETLHLGKQRFVISTIPNIPFDLPNLRITLTSISLPPTPLLHDHFITNGKDTALWRTTFTPDLMCNSSRAASLFECTLSDNCICTPAENKIVCQCPQKDIEQEFHQIQRKLPINTASWQINSFKGIVMAKIPHMVSAEVILSIKGKIDTAILQVQDDVCAIQNAELTGCYNCALGTVAKIKCTSQKQTLGEVICENTAFVVPCSPEIPASTLHFHLSTARQLINCSVACGKTKNYFILSGILKYVGDIQLHLLRALESNSTTYGEIEWPDFSHLLDVYLTWYKTVVIALIAVALALVISYALFQTVGLCLVRLILRVLITILCLPFRITIILVRTTLRHCRKNMHTQILPMHAKEL